jgi:hypothetical protein
MALTFASIHAIVIFACIKKVLYQVVLPTPYLLKTYSSRFVCRAARRLRVWSYYI